MYTTIINAVCFDYPFFGGRVVRTNGTHYILELHSNYQGRVTNRQLRLPVTAISQPAALLEGDIDQIEALVARQGRVLRRGYTVQ